eukprot:GHRQ01016400.1.p2 GENE.GHRQ01016400.1~~GHRQ01016400.1.p2  ORF type:complete len:123 (-),score=32.60 GHRQ01016400.1:1048-1416(-)
MWQPTEQDPGQGSTLERRHTVMCLECGSTKYRSSSSSRKHSMPPLRKTNARQNSCRISFIWRVAALTMAKLPVRSNACLPTEPCWRASHTCTSALHSTAWRHERMPTEQGTAHIPSNTLAAS